MDFINPERSLIKGVKSQSEADDETEQDQNQFPSFRRIYLSEQGRELIHPIGSFFSEA
jgi:hypothetical protein